MVINFSTRRRDVDNSVYFGSCIIQNWLFAAIKEEAWKKHISENTLIRKILAEHFKSKKPNGCIADPVDELDKRMRTSD